MTRINLYPYYIGFRDEEFDAIIIDNQIVYKYNDGIQGIFSIGKIPSNIISRIQKISWGSRLKDIKILNRLAVNNLSLDDLLKNIN
jgi:hypothetical protein